MRLSERASAAPRQKCGPWLKARWVLALARQTSKSSGSPYWVSSRLPAAYITITWAPSGMGTPPMSASRVAVR